MRRGVVLPVVLLVGVSVLLSAAGLFALSSPAAERGWQRNQLAVADDKQIQPKHVQRLNMKQKQQLPRIHHQKMSPRQLKTKSTQQLTTDLMLLIPLVLELRETLHLFLLMIQRQQ